MHWVAAIVDELLRSLLAAFWWSPTRTTTSIMLPLHPASRRALSLHKALIFLFSSSFFGLLYVLYAADCYGLPVRFDNVGSGPGTTCGDN